MKIEAAGATLHVEVDGPVDAPAVLLWNGAGCTTHMWDLVIPRLDDKLRVIRFDIRGTGQSIPATDPSQFTFERYALDADAILDELGIERTYIWSLAWGSRAALAYASWRAEHVVRLALFDASIGAADVKAQAAGHTEALTKQEASGILAA